MPAILATLFALPRWAKLALAGLALALAITGSFALWLHFHDKGVVEADRNASNAKAVSEARKADERAEIASEGKKQAIEEGNRDAEEAARNSDDPLADGLRKLRAKPR